MDNFRWWAFWRRLAYGAGFASFWALVGVVVYYTNFYQPPNCFDGVKNGNEIEVDAGGNCVRVATSQVIPPVVVWSESFAVTSGQYNAVAYIDNRNVTIGTPEIGYTFTFFNDGVEVGSRSGVTALPPNSSYPVFEGRIFSDEPITDTVVTLSPAELWVPAESSANEFRTGDLNLMSVDERPRLEAQLENTSLESARDVEVVATIFSDAGNAVAASQTFVESFPSRATKDVVFTWPNSIAKTVRSCTIPTSVILGIDLSGSMNNDGGDPPQPVSDALAAASSFVENLQPVDQVGVVTFATEATLSQQLTSNHTSVAAQIAALEIDPSEERGLTNTAAAFIATADELSSGRHSTDARRAFVLLTDGLPTAAGGVDALVPAQSAAAALIESGADVYVIGLGENVDQEFIRSIASSPSNAYLAPSRDDLASIYSTITASLCEVGPTKIEVIAKPPTTFTPLR